MFSSLIFQCFLSSVPSTFSISVSTAFLVGPTAQATPLRRSDFVLMPFHLLCENLLRECLAITLRFLVVSVDEVDQVEEASRDRSQWADVFRTSLLSMVSRKIVPQVIGEMMARGSARLLVRSLQIKFEITAKIDLDVLATPSGYMKCAIRNCAGVAGRFVPVHTGCEIYAADDAYDGPLGSFFESSSSIPQMKIVDWIAKFRDTKYVVVCSHPCWRHAETLAHLWPGRDSWQPLRGTRQMTKAELDTTLDEF